MPGADDLLAGRVLGGRYQLGAQLGTGVNAVVHEAVDLQLERAVAVKIVTAAGANEPGFQRRFRELASELAALSHPNILAVYDWGHEDVGLGDRPYLVTELVTGGSLRSMLDRGRTLTPSQALMVGLDACRGLDHAHRKGLVNGDINPANLLFGADRRVRVADFGLAALVARANRRRASDLDLATACYLSPEQAQDFVIDHKSDVYSLALSLVEAVTGAVPFAGDTTVATLGNRIDKLLPVSAELGALASVLERAGRPNPAERSSAAELGRALVQAAEKLPKPAPLPLVTGGPSLFEAPPGQETTSELTRFRDSTGAVVRDASGPVPRDPTGPDGATRPRTPRVAGDPSGAVPRPRVVTLDEQGGATDAAVRRPRGPVLAYLALVIGLVAASVLAVVAYRKLTEQSFDVPSLIGLEEGQARNEIANNDWEITVVRENTELQPQDLVFRTEPPAGASLREGDELVLYVSAGPPLATLPDVTGQTVDAATAALQEAGLSLVVGDQPYDEFVPAGQIISWVVSAQPTLVAGDEVVRNTAVTVRVSQGPAPREVPNLIGLTFDAAQAVVGEYALGVDQAAEPVFDDNIPAGGIVSQEPAPGSVVERGSGIVVTVSKGQDLVAVPELVGLDLETADARVREAGLTVGEVEGDAFTGRVIGASYEDRQLAVGELLRRGTAIKLILI